MHWRPKRLALNLLLLLQNMVYFVANASNKYSSLPKCNWHQWWTTAPVSWVDRSHFETFPRRRYPKTSVELPAEGLPVRFKSIIQTFAWPDKFLKVIAETYGERWLLKRLWNWRWNLSTAFSGIGAAESVTWFSWRIDFIRILMTLFAFMSNTQWTVW